MTAALLAASVVPVPAVLSPAARATLAAPVLPPAGGGGGGVVAAAITEATLRRSRLRSCVSRPDTNEWTSPRDASGSTHSPLGMAVSLRTGMTGGTGASAGRSGAAEDNVARVGLALRLPRPRTRLVPLLVLRVPPLLRAMSPAPAVAVLSRSRAASSSELDATELQRPPAAAAWRLRLSDLILPASRRRFPSVPSRVEATGVMGRVAMPDCPGSAGKGARPSNCSTGSCSYGTSRTARGFVSACTADDSGSV